MIRILVVVSLALALAGCLGSTDNVPLPKPIEAHVDGPVFAESRFKCGPRPMAPDVAKVDPQHQASAELRFRNDLGKWGQHCANLFNSVHGELKDAGQVIDSTGSDKP